MTLFIIQQRCQLSSVVMHPWWSSLGEFVLTVGLPDGSRPGCWPFLCRPPFSGMTVPSFVLPSLEIGSSSHHSWRLLLFKLSPLLWAASFGILSLWSVVDNVVSLIGSWCDKCGIVRELKEGCEVFWSCVNLWVREFCLGRSTFKGACLRNLLAGPSWEGFDVRTMVVFFFVY